MTGTTTNPSVWPTLRCRDSQTLIRFLVDAFGFEKAQVIKDAGVVQHAELRWPNGSGGLMMGDVGAADDDLHTRLPTGPVSVYVVCSDPGQLFERATSEGAEVLDGLKDEDYGSRSFTVRDPEGNVWSFGTYRGWLAAESAAEHSSPE